MSIISNSKLFKELNVLEEEFKQYVKLDVDNKYYDDNDYTTPYDVHQIILLSDYIDNDIVFDKYMVLLKTRILKLDEAFIDYFKSNDDIKRIMKTTYNERLYNAINSIFETGDIENMDDVYYSVDLMKKHNITDIVKNKLLQICDIECLEYVKNILGVDDDKYYDSISYHAVDCNRWDIILYLKTKIKLDEEDLCFYAAKYGKLDILKKLYNSTMFNDEYSCDIAINVLQADEIECFKFLVDNGCYIGSECYCTAIYDRDIELFDYLLEKKCIFNFNDCFEAIYGDELYRNIINNDVDKSKYNDRLIKIIYDTLKLLIDIENDCNKNKK